MSYESILKSLRVKQDLHVNGDVTIDGDFSFGNAATDELTVNGILSLKAAAGADAANAVLMGVGTTADPATTSTADDLFMEFRCQSTATSGDNRLLYMRYELAGTGGGECLRAFTKLAATVGTARGAHISLDIDDDPTGNVTGLGVGVDAQLLVGNAALSGGTLSALNAEIYSAGTSSDVSSATVSFIRVSNGGNATGAATVDAAGFLLNIQGLTAGSTKLFQTGNTLANAVATLKCKVGATTYYLPLYDGQITTT